MSDRSDNSPTRAPLFDPAAAALFWRYYRPRLSRLAVSTAGAALQATLALPVLLLIRRAFDRAIPEGNVQSLVTIGVAVVALRIGGSALSLAIRSHVLHTVKGAVSELRRDLVARVYRFSQRDMTHADLTLLHTRIVQDSERADHLGNVVFSAVIPAAGAFVVVFAALVALNPVLVVVAGAAFPLLWLGARVSGRLVQRRVFTFQRAFERFSKGVNFVVRQFDLTRTKANELPEIERQRQHIEALHSSGHSMAMSYAMHSQVQRTLIGIGGIVLLVFGGAAVAEGRMTLGAFITFYVAAMMLNGYIDTLTSSVPELLSGSQSLATLNRFLNDGEGEPYGGSQRIAFTGTVELRGVTFAFDLAPVLRSVSIVIPAGSHVALTGPNGAGKSTLLHLIVGFYRPQEGMLLADGIPYDQLDIRALRRATGVVPQRPAFFDGSVRDNITYGAPEVTQEELERACRLALADEVIATLPQGYDTPIGEHGVRLSGGEAQRIAIARALIGRPRLVILDEPTTHLDASAVARLMRGLAEPPDPPTILVVSHDPLVLESADRVYQLQGGLLTQQRMNYADAATA